MRKDFKTKLKIIFSTKKAFFNPSDFSIPTEFTLIVTQI